MKKDDLDIANAAEIAWEGAHATLAEHGIEVTWERHGKTKWVCYYEHTDHMKQFNPGKHVLISGVNLKDAERLMSFCAILLTTPRRDEEG